MRSLVFNIILAGAAFLPAAPAQAQVATQKEEYQGLGRSRQGNSGSLYDQLTRKAARKTTTDNAARLVGLTSLDYDGTAYVIQDSTDFSYSNGRGSGGYELSGMAGNFAHTNYDSGHVYRYDPASGSYTALEKFTQTFDVRNNPLTKKYAGPKWPFTNSWQNIQQEVCTYDAMSNLIGMVEQNWDTASNAWQNSAKYTVNYTGDGKIQNGLSELWNSVAGIWTNNRRESYTYDAAGNLLNLLIESWDSVSAGWQNYSKEINTYNSSNYLATKTLQNWNNTTGSWDNNSYETCTYDGSAHLTGDLFKTWDATSGAWKNATNFQYSAFSGTLPAIKVMQQWDAVNMVFVNSCKSETIYNSFGLPDFWSQQVWDETGGTWQPSPWYSAMRYYYETYVSGVKDIATMQGKAIFYPIPCSSNLNITVEWNKDQDFTITILDASGREYYSKKVAACKNYEGIISTDNFPTGMYIVNIESAEGRMAKQIVVER